MPGFVGPVQRGPAPENRIDIYICVRVFVYIYIYIQMYIYTHTHSDIGFLLTQFPSEKKVEKKERQGERSKDLKVF